MATNICNVAFWVITDYSVTGHDRELCDIVTQGSMMGYDKIEDAVL